MTWCQTKILARMESDCLFNDLGVTDFDTQIFESS